MLREQHEAHQQHVHASARQAGEASKKLSELPTNLASDLAAALHTLSKGRDREWEREIADARAREPYLTTRLVDLDQQHINGLKQKLS